MPLVYNSTVRFASAKLVFIYFYIFQNKILFSLNVIDQNFQCFFWINADLLSLLTLDIYLDKWPGLQLTQLTRHVLLNLIETIIWINYNSNNRIKSKDWCSWISSVKGLSLLLFINNCYRLSGKLSKKNDKEPRDGHFNKMPMMNSILFVLVCSQIRLIIFYFFSF